MYNNLLTYTYTNLLFTDNSDISIPHDGKYVLEITLFVIFMICLNLYILYLLVDHIKSNNANGKQSYVNTKVYINDISKNQMGTIILSKV